ncbi:MAG: outer membrane protein assembly factor BamD [Bacteroides sp.]|nr:outer membrane protein assembly factor BamD [Bacteroides sp.]MCM1379869.1 outer membrane protein assembly factor BamD [Bacteroides sp.]MCM1446099.1 outer membrane protein assembly factor BamD [Prevotella sp.]
MKKLLTFCILALSLGLLSSCGEYQRVLKTSDPSVKFDYAKKWYDEGKYAQAASVLSEMVSTFKGTERGEEILYMLGMCNYNNKDYLTAGTYLHTYYTRYPKGKYAEDAHYYTGKGYYLDSPDVQLDQSQTIQAIEELTSFLEYYPRSPRVQEVQGLIFELQDKLALKQLQNAQLYYNLGTYGGNNYQSAIIVAQNALKNYPYSVYKEDFDMLILKSRFKEADLSVVEKQGERFRQVIDQYYNFITTYPESKYKNEADNIFKIASKYVKE